MANRRYHHRGQIKHHFQTIKWCSMTIIWANKRSWLPNLHAKHTRNQFELYLLYSLFVVFFFCFSYLFVAVFVVAYWWILFYPFNKPIFTQIYRFYYNSTQDFCYCIFQACTIASTSRTVRIQRVGNAKHQQIVSLFTNQL